jgi:hypothetical protein
MRVHSKILTTLGTGIAIVALSSGSAVAAPPLPTENSAKYPASKGYYFVDDKIDMPAGSACSGAVTVEIIGHQRDYLNGKLVDPTDEQQPAMKLGDRLKGQAPDEFVIVTNTATGRSVTRKINGTITSTVVDAGSDGVLDLNLVGKGRNFYFGPGITGLVFAAGKQTSTVTDFANPEGFRLSLTTKGKRIDLCRKIGLQPVPGQHI